MLGYRLKNQGVKMNLKNLKNFKKGMKELSPTQLSKGKVAGYYGMVVGLTLATIQTLYNGSWGLGIFLGFLVWFQIMGLIGEKQSLKGLMAMEEQQKKDEEDNTDVSADLLNA